MHLATIDGPPWWPEQSDGRVDRRTDSLVDACEGGHVHDVLLFVRIWHLQTAGWQHAREGMFTIWYYSYVFGTCRQQVDARAGGHVHDMLLFAGIWHLQ